MEKPAAIAVVTGTRAEYGLLRPVLQNLAARPDAALALLVTGAHLSRRHGATVSEIEADGMPIAARIPILFEEDEGPLATARAVEKAIRGFSEWFAEHKPACCLVLGDRYEILAAAQAAAFTGVPVAHISGGDVTLGAQDDWYRHCLTKIAHLHFPSCEESAARVIRMGEAPATVFNVGGLGDENIRTMEKLDPAALSESVGFDLTRPFGLVTFHPQTAGGVDVTAQMRALLDAMDELTRTEGLVWLVTKSNADAGGLAINAMWDEWGEKHPDTAAVRSSLGVRRYLSAMAAAALVLGNSSSGVVETPTFGVPTVNVGGRQEGRPLCANVLCCPAEKQAVIAAVRKAVSPEFAAVANGAKSPYNGGDTSGKIVDILLEQVRRPEFGAPKVFYDGR